MKNFIIAALAALCIVLALRGCGRQTEIVKTRTDTVTLIRVDTVRYVDVRWRDRWQVRADTLPYAVTGDTIIAGDTIYVPVPILRHLFTDDTTYRAEISGYNVTLDKMEVFRRTVDRTVTIERTITPPPKRWGLGIQAGYGINTSGQVRPYIGIGISYNFIRF